MSNARHRTPPAGWAIGIQGRPPSRQARELVATLRDDILPPGLWHLSDHAALELRRAAAAPVIVEAIHQSSGVRFRLASLPGGPILAVECLCPEVVGSLVATWSSRVGVEARSGPTHWANHQQWRIDTARS